jgi:hypothetical protein
MTKPTEIPAWMRTIAETIAALLHDDGLRFTADDGRTLDDLVSDYPHDVAWRDGWRTGDVRRIDFRDGSCLTVAGNAWDLGYPACWCWQGAGHTDDCTQRD